MRLTRDLITELDQEASAGNFTEVALAIAFPDGTSLLFNTDPKKLDQLNAYIRGGDRKSGLLGFRTWVATGLIPPYVHCRNIQPIAGRKRSCFPWLVLSPTDHNEAQLYF